MKRTQFMLTRVLQGLVAILLIATVNFMLVRAANKVMKFEAVAAGDPADVVLLKEIRDELRARPKISAS